MVSLVQSASSDLLPTPEMTSGEALASPKGPAIFTSCLPTRLRRSQLAGWQECITHLSTQGSAGVSRPLSKSYLPCLEKKLADLVPDQKFRTAEQNSESRQNATSMMCKIPLSLIPTKTDIPIMRDGILHGLGAGIRIGYISGGLTSRDVASLDI
ncbi:unnamed protein product [Clonostachys rosea]|uniref:Uncharacterized protein n=1 Tax=Bionectria ochroleuca TaxID=29856 RepID=A0ABY6U2D3_BIOOC|nr:unnamed protein product [Clonostachys rosea]